MFNGHLEFPMKRTDGRLTNFFWSQGSQFGTQFVTQRIILENALQLVPKGRVVQQVRLEIAQQVAHGQQRA
ncbi:hypothetical protein D3C86_2078320 [compost metagenome]